MPQSESFPNSNSSADDLLATGLSEDAKPMAMIQPMRSHFSPRQGVPRLQFMRPVGSQSLSMIDPTLFHSDANAASEGNGLEPWASALNESPFFEPIRSEPARSNTSPTETPSLSQHPGTLWNFPSETTPSPTETAAPAELTKPAETAVSLQRSPNQTSPSPTGSSPPSSPPSRRQAHPGTLPTTPIASALRAASRPTPPTLPKSADSPSFEVSDLQRSPIGSTPDPSPQGELNSGELNSIESDLIQSSPDAANRSEANSIESNPVASGSEPLSAESNPASANPTLASPIVPNSPESGLMEPNSIQPSPDQSTLSDFNLFDPNTAKPDLVQRSPSESRSSEPSSHESVSGKERSIEPNLEVSSPAKLNRVESDSNETSLDDVNPGEQGISEAWSEVELTGSSPAYSDPAVPSSDISNSPPPSSTDSTFVQPNLVESGSDRATRGQANLNEQLSSESLSFESSEIAADSTSVETHPSESKSFAPSLTESDLVQPRLDESITFESNVSNSMESAESQPIHVSGSEVSFETNRMDGSESIAPHVESFEAVSPEAIQAQLMPTQLDKPERSATSALEDTSEATSEAADSDIHSGSPDLLSTASTPPDISRAIASASVEPNTPLNETVSDSVEPHSANPSPIEPGAVLEAQSFAAEANTASDEPNASIAPSPGDPDIAESESFDSDWVDTDVSANVTESGNLESAEIISLKSEAPTSEEPITGFSESSIAPDVETADARSRGASTLESSSSAPSSSDADIAHADTTELDVIQLDTTELHDHEAEAGIEWDAFDAALDISAPNAQPNPLPLDRSQPSNPQPDHSQPHHPPPIQHQLDPDAPFTTPSTPSSTSSPSEERSPLSSSSQPSNPALEAPEHDEAIDVAAEVLPLSSPSVDETPPQISSEIPVQRSLAPSHSIAQPELEPEARSELEASDTIPQVPQILQPLSVLQPLTTVEPLIEKSLAEKSLTSDPSMRPPLVNSEESLALAPPPIQPQSTSTSGKTLQRQTQSSASVSSAPDLSNFVSPSAELTTSQTGYTPDTWSSIEDLLEHSAAPGGQPSEGIPTIQRRAEADLNSDLETHANEPPEQQAIALPSSFSSVSQIPDTIQPSAPNSQVPPSEMAIAPASPPVTSTVSPRIAGHRGYEKLPELTTLHAQSSPSVQRQISPSAVNTLEPAAPSTNGATDGAVDGDRSQQQGLGAGGSPGSLDKLAHSVYTLVRQRLKLEQERNGFNYPRRF